MKNLELLRHHEGGGGSGQSESQVVLPGRTEKQFGLFTTYEEMAFEQVPRDDGSMGTVPRLVRAGLLPTGQLHLITDRSPDKVRSLPNTSDALEQYGGAAEYLHKLISRVIVPQPNTTPIGIPFGKTLEDELRHPTTLLEVKGVESPRRIDRFSIDFEAGDSPLDKENAHATLDVSGLVLADRGYYGVLARFGFSNPIGWSEHWSWVEDPDRHMIIVENLSDTVNNLSRALAYWQAVLNHRLAISTPIGGQPE